MRADLLSSLALGWVVSLVGCHTPGSELESVRYGPTEERVSDTFTVANINITYKDEHGTVFSEISEVINFLLLLLLTFIDIRTPLLYKILLI